MKYIITLIFCFTISSNQAFAQKDTAYNDKLILNAYNYLGNNLDSAVIAANIAKQQVKKQSVWYIRALNIEGYVLNMRSKTNQAILKMDTAIEICRLNNYNNDLASSYNTQSINYMYVGNYAKSIEIQFLCLDIAKKLNEKKLCGRVLNNISLNYEYLKDWDNAIMFAKEGLTIKKDINDSAGVLSSFTNIANYYFDKKFYDSSYSYNQQGISLAKKIDNFDGLTNAYRSLGTIFYEKNQFDSSLYYLLLSYKTIRNDFSEANKMSVYIGLLNLYIQLHNPIEFNKINKEAKAVLPVIDDPEILFNYHQILYKFYKQENNTQNAFAALEKSNYYKEKLDSSSNNIEFQKLAIKYEVNKKAVADSLVMQQQVNIAKTKTVESQNRLLIVSIILLMALAVAGFLYNRSNLLKKKNIIIEQEKQIEAQQKIAYQLKTLQAQMNPHFVFNCFNTIDSFILQNKQYEASLLVQRFSKLSRKILEQTAVNTISFEEELETLATYLQIEKLRSNNSFDFSIEKEDAILNYQLPPMLLQPFVENAVVHGVRTLQNNTGFIKITASDNDNFVEINIEDNGVGRSKAAELKEQTSSTHRSMSMDLTLQRLEALHQNAGIQNYLQFTDFNNDKTGTLVTIKIPKSVNGE